MANFPKLSDLPLGKHDPALSAWGLWGQDDELGMLNHLTPDVVRAALRECTLGLRISLNWGLENPKTPGFGRSIHDFQHKITKSPGALVLDDSFNEFNTQKSSQWDGLRHFAYQKEQLFYNRTSLSQILHESTGKLGIQNWSKAGGIAGRGILIDYQSWAERNNRVEDMTKSVAIKYDDLMACYRDQQQASPTRLELRTGDILIVRSGYTKKYLEIGSEEEEKLGKALPPQTSGIHQDKRILEWLWNSQIAAVGGDAPAWECLPADPGSDFLYHEVLIAGWGCPIAELLWLEDLAAACQDNKKWTFLLTSSPLNVFGGVASPANMMAIL